MDKTKQYLVSSIVILVVGAPLIFVMGVQAFHSIFIGATVDIIVFAMAACIFAFNFRKLRKEHG